VVERVSGFEAKFDIHLLADRELFAQGKIAGECPGAADAMSQNDAAVGTPIDNNCFGGSICLESRGPVTGDAAYLNVEQITRAPEAWMFPSTRFEQSRMRWGACALAASQRSPLACVGAGAWKPDQISGR
jgi:hypothetical protein